MSAAPHASASAGPQSERAVRANYGEYDGRAEEREKRCGRPVPSGLIALEVAEAASAPARITCIQYHARSMFSIKYFK